VARCIGRMDGDADEWAGWKVVTFRSNGFKSTDRSLAVGGQTSFFLLHA
jgi:hypothetical protein